MPGWLITYKYPFTKGGLHDAPGSPFPAGKAPWAVAIDDMNHDGNLDLVIIPYARDVPGPKDVGVTVLLGDGKGLYLGSRDGDFTISARSVQTGWAGVAVADLEGCGKRRHRRLE